MPRYWFRQKSFGYGATPNSWQGWALTVTGLLLLFGVVAFAPAIRDNILRAAWLVIGIPAVTGPFVALAHARTEGGWRWRSGD
jgi:hypothetical protein